MGGDPNGKRDIIENLMGLCRKCHERYGDKKQFKAWLYRVHKQKLEANGKAFDVELIDSLIEKYAN
jgi:5-methylcytosine-specific restriction endonuclease McrA